ncbi:MAG: dTMP kinase [Magnetococcales bacterium]|nr:dTMP kinase [Magnetococcales bacterium]
MEEHASPGRFITFEGGEGSGKSTQINRLAEHLRSLPSMAQVEVVTTREPGGTPMAEDIRELLVTGKPNSMQSKTELLLVLAARVEHVETLINPVLQKGGWVLCDRFVDSTLAYQGYGRGMSLEHLNMLNNWALSGLKPDLTLFLDIDPLSGLERTKPRGANSEQSGEAEDRFEQTGVKFHKLVYDGFCQLARQNPGRIKSVDARQNMEDVQKAIWGVVSSAFPNL